MEDIHILAKWRRIMAMIVVILQAILSWAHVMVVDPKLMMMGMVTILGMAIQGRIKLLESHEEVKLVRHHSFWEKTIVTTIIYDEWAYATNMLKRGDEVGYSDGAPFTMKALCKVNLVNFNCHGLKATILIACSSPLCGPIFQVIWETCVIQSSIKESNKSHLLFKIT
jgi:hypothetical protein